MMFEVAQFFFCFFCVCVCMHAFCFLIGICGRCNDPEFTLGTCSYLKQKQLPQKRFLSVQSMSVHVTEVSLAVYLK